MDLLGLYARFLEGLILRSAYKDPLDKKMAVLLAAEKCERFIESR